ncbi:hypothetical protein GCM10023143_32360 [Compostibacter hankyongensis]|uniref:Uncharacterized protein n=2 Tax=Compostibacter hankyongensis TaxID=1007089 RepID=A0ABP8G805_9BACT
MVYTQAKGKLIPSLQGKQLELSIEQMPHAFALNDKTRIVGLLYYISLETVYIQPELKDMVVSYKLLQDNQVVKRGRIAIPDSETNTPIKMFQSWKTATGNHIALYNHNIDNMARTFVDEMSHELDPSLTSAR